MRWTVLIFLHFIFSSLVNAQNAVLLDSVEKILRSAERRVTNVGSEINDVDLNQLKNVRLNLRRLNFSQNSLVCYITNDIPSEQNIGFHDLHGILVENQNKYLLFDGGYSGFNLTNKITLFDSSFNPKAVYHFNNRKLTAVSIFQNDGEIIVEKICLIYKNNKDHNFNFLNLNDLFDIGYAEGLFVSERYANGTDNVYYQKLGVIEFNTKYLIER